jgi:flagellar hook-associated protein 3 FlgL
MRISTAQMYRTGVEAMQDRQATMQKIGLQLSSGKEILTPADDPNGATQAAEFRTRIESVTQYQRNLDLVIPRLQQEEWSIAGVVDQLQRARELIVAANNEPQGDDTRGFMADEIREIRQALFDIANTKDASGEYIFAGTSSVVTPFVKDHAGVITYVGAQGEGAVREVAITASRTLAIGDTGADTFMNIKENDGRIMSRIYGGTNSDDVPGGTLVVEDSHVNDLAEFQSGTNATDTFKIHFREDSASESGWEYAITTQDDPVDWNTAESYEPGMTIEFAGRMMRISGLPDDTSDPSTDIITSEPAQHASVFQTLEDIADALDTPVGGQNSRADLINAVNRALVNIDATIDHLGGQRASIGTRLQAADAQTEVNESLILEWRSALSDVEDLDYISAVSDYSLQQVAYDAVTKVNSQFNRMSLFQLI